jgi:GntR family transcriptional regulator/MocR family aminotransferase
LLSIGVEAGNVPLHVRLYRQLREHILAGALAPGARLPSARMLARDLKLSRNTVEAAFAQLVDEGFVERRVGAGSVVAQTLTEVAPFARGANPRALPRATPRLGRRGSAMHELGRAEVEADARSGTWHTNAPGFPWQAWNRLIARETRRQGTAFLGTVPQLGLESLRRQIAETASLARGLHCSWEQVVVVSSTQQALDLTARVLLDPGDPAAIEEPCYPSARAALLAAGARLTSVSVDEEGLVVADLERRRSGRPSQSPRTPRTPRTPRMVYVTPSHQFPLGHTMSLARRIQLLRWASAGGEDDRRWVVEDDYDSEFRYDGRPIAALYGLDTAERVLYVGTFNKVLFPGLRLAYMVVPPSLVPVFEAARRIVDGFSAPLAQAVLAEFMASGQFTSYLRQARQHFALCRERLVAALEERLGDAVTLGPSTTGLHFVAHFTGKRAPDDVAVAARCTETAGGLSVAPLSRYYFSGSPGPRGLLLSYGTLDPERAEDSVAAVGAAMRR